MDRRLPTRAARSSLPVLDPAGGMVTRRSQLTGEVQLETRGSAVVASGDGSSQHPLIGYRA
jgi:hypothetical protein